MVTRRGFLAAMPAARVLGANSRINIGCIGVGGNGGNTLKRLVERSAAGDIRVAAVCDVYKARRERARATASLGAGDAFVDYRELLAKPGLDAIFISTPDHWHAPLAIEAMKAGKDVYLQKPMTLTIPEARTVHETATKLGRVLQVGSQHLSDPRLAKAREIVQSGELGELLWAQSTYSRNSVTGEWNYYIDEEASPETIDWKRWLGPAPQRPFSAERYFRWRKYWDYSGGIATDLYYHRLGPLLAVMGRQFPARVTASGGIYVHKDREVPDTYETTVEYPGFYISLSGSTANAGPLRFYPQVIYGHRATLLFEDDKLTVVPENLPPEKSGKEKVYEVPRVDVTEAHITNFLGCMRTRAKPALDSEFGYQLMTAIKLGVDSYRDGAAKYCDPRTGAPLAKSTMRPGYEGTGKNEPQGRKKRQ